MWINFDLDLILISRIFPSLSSNFTKIRDDSNTFLTISLGFENKIHAEKFFPGGKVIFSVLYMYKLPAGLILTNKIYLKI